MPDITAGLDQARALLVLEYAEALGGALELLGQLLLEHVDLELAGCVCQLPGRFPQLPRLPWLPPLPWLPCSPQLRRLADLKLVGRAIAAAWPEDVSERAAQRPERRTH